MSGPACTVDELADALGGTVEGDGQCVITGVAGLREAEPGDISFLARAAYLRHVKGTKASALVAPLELGVPFEGPLIRVENPNAAFQRIAERFAPPTDPGPSGIHPTAVIAEGAGLGEGIGVGACVVIEEGARIGDRTRIWAGCYIGRNVVIGCDGRIYPHVSIRDHSQIGDRATIHNGTCIGTDGFGFEVNEKNERTKVEQLGTVWIGDDVEIGANVTVDRARFGTTRIGHGVKIDNLVQIAHNVLIEDHVVLVAQVGIAGSVIIRRHAVIGGQAGVIGHVEVGEGAFVGGQGGVTKYVPPGAVVSGYPARPHAEATRLHAGLARLPQLKKRVAELEDEVRKLTERLTAE